MQAICSQETTAQSDEFVYGSSSSEIATRPVTKGKAATQHRGSDKLRDANHTKRSEQPSPEDVGAILLNPASGRGRFSSGSSIKTAPDMPGLGGKAVWKKPRVKSKTCKASSVGCSPLSPGLVTPSKQEKLQEKRSDNPGKDPIDEAQSEIQQSIMGMKVTDKAGRPTSQKDSGRLRIRLTPQHFSRLGTTFRHVQVHFMMMRFTIQAVDCEGYAWTASSSLLPGLLAVDRCKYKIDPAGKYVLITLWPEYEHLPLKGLDRLELRLPPYESQKQVGDSKENFI